MPISDEAIFDSNIFIYIFYVLSRIASSEIGIDEPI
jgi:hypothetical protein